MPCTTELLFANLRPLAEILRHTMQSLGYSPARLADPARISAKALKQVGMGNDSNEEDKSNSEFETRFRFQAVPAQMTCMSHSSSLSR
jgi:hypothetical protein